MPRPFYVFAHNPNTLEEAELALKHGANALEPDLMVLPSGSRLGHAPFTPNPTGIVVYHDHPTYTPRVPSTLDQYLDGIHRLAIDHPHLALLVFDITTSASQAEYGLQLLDSIHKHLNFDGVNVNVIFAIGERSQATITVSTGEINLVYENSRMERGNTDYVTIPSADLGLISSITIHNDGGGLGDGWHLASIRVSSARYIGPNTNHNAEYVATFNDWIKVGETRTVALRKVKFKLMAWSVTI
ncbi:MAG: PLAT/LH2 domain-containing protein [Pseudomonadota bacterium]